jgi:hypothetical protein
MLGVLLASFLAGAPFVAHAAGSLTYDTSVREAQAQRAASQPVQAMLLQSAAQWTPENFGSEVSARWKAPDGRVITGQVYVPDGTTASSKVTIWVNRAGQLTNVPMQRSQVMYRTELSEGLAVAALALVLIAAGCAGHGALDRRRLAGWDAEWLAAGSRWSPGGKTPASGD